MSALVLGPRRAAHALIRFYQLTLSLAARPRVPVFADLLGLRGRSDPAAWAVGGLVDGLGAGMPLPPVGRLGLRPAAAAASLAGFLGAAVALSSLALAPRMTAASLACPAPDHYGLTLFQSQPLRDLIHGRAAPRRRICASYRGRAFPHRRGALLRRHRRHAVCRRDTRAFAAAGATLDLSRVPGALEIPAGIAIALDAAEAAGAAL